MSIAILVFFIAIFGGVLFLLGLIWFVFRRIRNSRSENRNFTGSSNYGSSYVPTQSNYISSDDDSGVIYADNSTVENRDSEKEAVTETAQESAQQSDNTYSHESCDAFSAPAETSYTESSYSSYDSGSSSYDSGSSSSDSGSSSSSSD